MKFIFKYSAVFLFVLVVNSVSAQNMGALNRMLSAQNMQFQHQLSMQMNMSMRYLNHNTDNTFETPFQVTMLDGTKKDFRSVMHYDSVTHKAYLVFVDKKLPKSDTSRSKKIYPGQTLDIQYNRGGGEFDDNWYKGMPNDTCWMFKVVSGAISVYSFLPIEASPFTQWTLSGLQLNNDPIIKFTEENLKKMVQQDADALENIKKKDYFKAVKKYNQHAEKAAKK